MESRGLLKNRLRLCTLVGIAAHSFVCVFRTLLIGSDENVESESIGGLVDR